MKNEHLVTQYMKLAYSIAWKMQDTGIELEELQSLALLGLVKAGDTYSERRGASFYTYASVVITREILKELREQKKQRNQVSLSTPITADEKWTLEDVLEDKRNDYLLAEVKADIERLDTNEKNAICLMLFEGMKQIEAAKIIGVSQSMISQYYRSGIQKLKQDA